MMSYMDLFTSKLALSSKRHSKGYKRDGIDGSGRLKKKDKHSTCQARELTYYSMYPKEHTFPRSSSKSLSNSDCLSLLPCFLLV